jgi:NitT/TauT family transport system substrate-binding protein
VWAAQEAGIFAKHGLDVDLSYIASAQTVAAVLANEIDVALGGGYAAMSARLAGSDLLIFYGVTTWYPYELMVTGDVNSPADLRGRRLGVSRFGSSSDIATRLAVQHLGLDAEQDVTYIQMGSIPERIAAMRAGAIAGGLASPPQPTLLRREGFKSLMDLAALGDQAMIMVAYAPEPWIRANEPAAQALVNALIEAAHFAKNNPEYTQRIIAEYTKMDDPEAVADGYEYFIRKNAPRLARPSVDDGRRYLESQAPTDPRAVGARAEEFFDLRFVDRAAASGIVERLYGS